ncbi:MAG: hypothetical protein FJ280_11860 [Planctomycetes bacterium]|nr:hypothetical protein [Planctomycetota bacterium]
MKPPAAEIPSTKFQIPNKFKGEEIQNSKRAPAAAGVWVITEYLKALNVIARIAATKQSPRRQPEIAALGEPRSP